MGGSQTQQQSVGKWFTFPVMKRPKRPLSPTHTPLPPVFWMALHDDVHVQFFQQVTDTQCLSLAVCASVWLCSRIDSFIGAICQQAFDDNRPWCGSTDPSGSPLYRPRCHFDEAEVVMSLCACACEYAMVCVCGSYSALLLHYRFNLPTIHTHMREDAHIFSLFLRCVCRCISVNECSRSLPVRSLFTSAAIFNCCWPKWGFTISSV